MMMLKTLKIYLFIGIFCISASCFTQSYRVVSPNNSMEASLQKNAEGSITYAVKFKNKLILEPSKLGFALNKPKMSLDKFEILSANQSTFDETWQPVWGEVKEIRNHYNELTARLKSSNGVEINVVLMMVSVFVTNSLSKVDSSILLSKMN
jgi:glucan 1,4-alpha-glucosidase